MNKRIPIDHTLIAGGKVLNPLKPPSYLIEVTFLGLLLYMMLVGPILGKIIPLAGAGTLALLTVVCLFHFGSYSVGALKPIRFALACGISLLVFQVVFFHESILHPWMRNFITWVLSLIVIQSLSFRNGFFHRFAFVAFLIGCGTLPFLNTYLDTGDVERLGARGMPLGNPNFFGVWFGFCTIYFLITGLEAKNYIIRTASWTAGIFCLYMTAITVSRGALLGVAIAIVIASQRILKRNFLPILGFFILLWFVYMSGLFDDLIGYYLHRGTEETGRSRLWAWAIDGIYDSWGLGVGMSNAFYTIEITGETFGPHNSFLFIFLSSGFIPLIFYITYLVQATRGALRAHAQKVAGSSYMLPMVSFALLSVMVADTTFMSTWHLIVFSLAISTSRVESRSEKRYPMSMEDSVRGQRVLK